MNSTNFTNFKDLIIIFLIIRLIRAKYSLPLHAILYKYRCDRLLEEVELCQVELTK